MSKVLKHIRALDHERKEAQWLEEQIEVHRAEFEDLYNRVPHCPAYSQSRTYLKDTEEVLLSFHTRLTVSF